VLAALSVDANHVVSVDQLAYRIWGIDPPPRARGVLSSYISRLRQVLGADHLVWRSGGYVLAVAAAQVDLNRFRDLRDQARASDDDRRRVDLLTGALALWRGAALTGLDGQWVLAQRGRLHQQRLLVERDLTDARLRAGHGETLVADLFDRVAEHPLDERVAAQYMVALYRDGRVADALQHYRKFRAQLADELGIDPGAALQELQQRILAGDARLAPPEQPGTATQTLASQQPLAPPPTVSGAGFAELRRVQDEELGVVPGPELTAPFEKALSDDAIRLEPTRSPAISAVVPTQLPRDVADFTGRATEASLVAEHMANRETAAAVCVISGQAGVGKSALATHVAHRMVEAFPDGQLYVNLRGARPVPTGAAEALAAFLRALGVAEVSIPPSLDERTGLFCTLTTGKRLLVVLDDAADESQVRPLITASGSAATLITCRRRLSALEGAAHLDLDVLDERNALTLLEQQIGGARLQRELSAAKDVVRQVGYLPLAVRIVGARLGARPDRDIAVLADRLRAQQRTLDELVVGDLQVRSSLALSYLALGPREQVGLRRLGWVGTPSFSAWVLAPLLDVPVGMAADVVDELVDARLVTPLGKDCSGQERYQLHELTRVFARERAEAEENLPEALAAFGRAVDWWLTLLGHASDQVPTDVARLRRVKPSNAHARLAEVDSAALIAAPLGWVEAEQPTLMHVVIRAAELGLLGPASWLAAALSTSPQAVRTQFPLWWEAKVAELEEANFHEPQPTGAASPARFDEAARYYRRTLVRHSEQHDAEGEAAAQMGLSVVLREQGDLTGALRALENLPDASISSLTRARIEHNRGMVLTEQGGITQALAALTHAVQLYQAAGDQCGVALAWMSICMAHRAEGQLDEAARYGERALRDLRTIGQPTLTANALQALAKVRIRQGRGTTVHVDLIENLSTCRKQQDRFGEALTLRTLGELELAAGRLHRAKEYLERSLLCWDALALPLWRARTLRDLAITLNAQGHHADADSTWKEALTTFRQHRSREATEPLRKQTSNPLGQTDVRHPV